MTPNKKICAKCFCVAFAEQWKDDVTNENDILVAYPDYKQRTAYMLGREDSFLSRLSKKLCCAMAREWYKLDAVFYDENQNLCHRGMYPACFHVIVEHENNDDVETEMWKLLMFRSPLKVLIFYDWSENQKQISPQRAKWLDKKLLKLFSMGENVDALWPEANDTEYLFLVGNQSEEGQIVWRNWTVNQGDFGKARQKHEQLTAN